MNKYIAAALILVLVVGSAWYFNQSIILRKAHSSFENYYTFRGCQSLVQKTETWGTCKLSDGKTIKIVEFKGKWFLDGDLPWGCIGNFCYGI